MAGPAIRGLVEREPDPRGEAPGDVSVAPGLPAGGLVLGLLRDNGPLSPSELGDRLIVTRATVTGVVDSLERRGYARRTPNPADRRSLLVELTPEGFAVVAQVRTLIHRTEKAWMSALSDEELRSFIDLHHRIQDHVGSLYPLGPE